MSRTNEDRANIAAGMSVKEKRDKAAELGVSMSDFKAGAWRPSQGATPKPTPSPSPSPSPKPTPTPSPSPSKPSPSPSPTPTPSPSPSNWSTAKDKATTHTSNKKRTNEDRAAIAAGMSVADRREKAKELGVSLSDFKAGIWKPKHATGSTGGNNGGFTQNELADLFGSTGPVTSPTGPYHPVTSPGPAPTPTPTYTPTPTSDFVSDPYIPPAPVVQPVTPTTPTDTNKGDEKNSPFQSSFTRNYVGFENPYRTQIQPMNPGTTQPQPQPGPVGTTAPNPIRCDPPKINGGKGTGTTSPGQPGQPSINVKPDEVTWSGGHGHFSEATKDMPKPGPGTNGTSFIPYSSTDYFNKYGTPAISQQMYINDPYEGSKGQGFYGAAQFTPTNPFTGEPYKIGSDGLPDHGNLYSQGTYLPGQLIPTKKKS